MKPYSTPLTMLILMYFPKFLSYHIHANIGTFNGNRNGMQRRCVTKFHFVSSRNRYFCENIFSVYRFWP